MGLGFGADRVYRAERSFGVYGLIDYGNPDPLFALKEGPNRSSQLFGMVLAFAVKTPILCVQSIGAFEEPLSVYTALTLRVSLLDPCSNH